jgi:hypothetical protein
VRIPPAVETIYCGIFHDRYTALCEGIPESRLSRQFAAFFVHDMALSKIENLIPDPSRGARNPDGRPQWRVWVTNMHTAVREYLAFDEEIAKDYEKQLFGKSTGAATDLRDKDKAVLRRVLDETDMQRFQEMADTYAARQNAQHPDGHRAR